MQLSTEETQVVWAAMMGMVHGDEKPEDYLTTEQIGPMAREILSRLHLRVVTDLTAKQQGGMC